MCHSTAQLCPWETAVIIVQILIVMSHLHPEVLSRCVSSDPGWRSLQWVLRGVLEGMVAAVYQQPPQTLSAISESNDDGNEHGTELRHAPTRQWRCVSLMCE